MIELVVDNDRSARPPTPAAPAVSRARIEIVPTALPYLRAMESDMRPADRCEIAGLGVTVRKALWRAYRNSPVCKTALVDGQVAAMWGVCVGLHAAYLPNGAKVPWLHTTSMVEKLPVSFVKIAKTELAAMIALYPRLESYVAAEYAGAIGLLKLLGFTIDAPAPVGANGEIYCRFWVG